MATIETRVEIINGRAVDVPYINGLAVTGMYPSVGEALAAAGRWQDQQAFMADVLEVPHG